MTQLVLNVLSALSALVAAGFWWASALVPAPQYLGWGTFAPDNYKETKAPGVVWAELVSTRNKWGAAFAALAAVLSAAATFFGIDWGQLK
jgi:hypothetical protein